VNTHSKKAGRQGCGDDKYTMGPKGTTGGARKITENRLKTAWATVPKLHRAIVKMLKRAVEALVNTARPEAPCVHVGLPKAVDPAPQI